MKPSSEYQHLAAIKNNQEGDLYKACITVANHGLKLPEEDKLTNEEKSLLLVRRMIFEKKLTEAEDLINSLSPNDNLLFGDKLFLLGQIYHKLGKQDLASGFMFQAADYYKQTGDKHRELRARVNAAICIVTLEDALFGVLYSFELEARQNNFFDIAGNIVRTKAMLLLSHGRLQESYSQAMEAANCYKLDGYQDDYGVTIYIAAIAQFLLGNIALAVETRNKAMTSEGKSESYKKIFDDLIAGNIPKVHEGHPLYDVKWKRLTLKPESIPGKIVQKLQERPYTRDELIQEIWGENALSQAYCDRLYTAIKSLRKERSIAVLFDGEYYKLI